ERELSDLWRDPDGSTGAVDAVTRTCMSNLIIYCGSTDRAAKLAEEIGLIVQHHPARVLLLVGEAPSSDEGITAKVSAYWTKIDGRRQVCSEHVTLTASPAAARRLPSVARSLVIGDLPTSLWWDSHEPPPMGGDLFNELAAMAGQIIYESQ